MLNLFAGLEKPSTPAEPVVIELENIELEETSGQLVIVSELEESDERPAITVEGSEVSLESYLDARPSITSDVLEQREQLGLDLSKAEWKPAPMIVGHEGVTYVYLIGACHTTVDPLLHMLLGGSAEDSITIELNCPYLPSGVLLTIATAIQQSSANVTVNCAYTTTTYETIVALSCKTPNVSEGFFVLTPMKYWASGTSMDMKTQTAMYESYCESVFSYLKVKGLLTDEEINDITDKDEHLLLRTDEVRSRIGQ